MIYKPGQVLLGRLRFLDGNFPKYDRPYLIVYVMEDKLGVINVSSTEGKEHKLFFDDNYKIEHYNPPLIKPSFAKIDSLQFIKIENANKMRLLDCGKTLNEKDFAEIIKRIEHRNSQ